MDIENIWRKYESSLRGFLLKNISNPDDVDDLLQEVLIKTYHKLPTLRDSNKVKSWLFQVTNNTIIDFYRSSKPKLSPTEPELWHKEPEQQVLQQLSQCILPFISALPKADADLLTAIEIEGLSQKEFAKKAGINYSTLKSRVQKSRKALFGLFNQCCTFSIDSQGRVTDYQAKNKTCSGC